MDLFVLSVACLTVCLNCLVKQLAIFLGVVVILLSSVGRGGGALLDKNVCLAPVIPVCI